MGYCVLSYSLNRPHFKRIYMNIFKRLTHRKFPLYLIPGPVAAEGVGPGGTCAPPELWSKEVK